MHAIEFHAVIENGIVHIPKEYKDLQEKREVRFFILYDDKTEPNVEKRKKKMSAISIDTTGFKFDRDEAS